MFCWLRRPGLCIFWQLGIGSAFLIADSLQAFADAFVIVADGFGGI